jgi:hypothetical protein
MMGRLLHEKEYFVLLAGRFPGLYSLGCQRRETRQD